MYRQDRKALSYWCARLDSDQRPSDPQSDTLSTELRAQTTISVFLSTTLGVVRLPAVSAVEQRRGKDSNPRYPFGYNCFQDSPDKPLQHPALSGCILLLPHRYLNPLGGFGNKILGGINLLADLEQGCGCPV